MCSCEDADPPEFFSEATRRARKEHKCDECYEVIRPGDRYRHVSGKWDGRVGSYQFCLKCARFQDAFHDAEGCYAPLGMAREMARECISEDPGFSRRLLAALRQSRTEKRVA